MKLKVDDKRYFFKFKNVKLLFFVLGDNLSIFSIDIHPDGTKFATGGQGNDCGRVAIWNMQPIVSQEEQFKENVPKLLSKIDSHLQCVNAVRWSKSGNYLASAGDDQLIMIWTLSGQYSGPGPTEHYRTVATLRSHSGDILDISWSYDDQWLASCSVDNMVVIWNAQRWPEIVKILTGHTGLVKGITWDPIGKYLASQSDDKTLRVWRVSDWTEEVNIHEPFEQCGGTTHFLRLSWSPDGQFLVSAQAMNNCGSVAKIIERQNWSATKDFVGHRKAIPCVRFNSNIFKLCVSKNGENKKPKYRRHCVIAMGSRDRSISIWVIGRSRPLVTISDIFKNSVLDLSWSKSGYQLMACSHDGSIVYLEFTPEELGSIYSEDERIQCLQQLYGSSIGTKNLVHNNLIEDMDIMMLHTKASEKVSTNGVCKEEQSSKTPEAVKPLSETNNSNSSTTASKNAQSSPLAKGPTDKQIEIRSADGKRRIIPLFIPPCTTTTGQNSEPPTSATIPSRPISFSSSSESKSKIVIETRDESNPSSSYQTSPNNKLTNGNSLASINNASKEEPDKMTQSNNAQSNKSNDTDLSKNKDKSKTQSMELDNPNSTTNGVSNNVIQISDDSSDEEIIVKRQKVYGVKKKSKECSSSQAKRKPGRPPGSGYSKQNSIDVANKSIVDVTIQTNKKSKEVPLNSVNNNQIQATSGANTSIALTNTMFFPPLKLTKQSQFSVKLFNLADNNQLYCKFYLIKKKEYSSMIFL